MNDKWQSMSSAHSSFSVHQSSLTLAGEGGFEPPNGGSKGRCLTAWRLPSIEAEWIKLSNLVAWTFRYAPDVKALGNRRLVNRKAFAGTADDRRRAPSRPN